MERNGIGYCDRMGMGYGGIDLNLPVTDIIPSTAMAMQLSCV